MIHFWITLTGVLSSRSFRVKIIDTVDSFQPAIILSYFVHEEGFKEAAEKFKVESGIQPAVDLDTLDERIKIRDAVQTGRIEEAIAYVNNLHPELLDNNRYLYFHLQVIIG